MAHHVHLLVSVVLFCILTIGPTPARCDIRIRKGAAHVLLNNPRHVLLRGTLRPSRQERSYFAFYGVRYAKPPRRFERPEPLDDDGSSNVTVVDAAEWGPSCARWSRFLRKYTGSEDCLFLNVFVPNVHLDPPLPVLLYIHGGAFADGESESHGPEFFMDEDVILVTMNYRLGALGFLSTSDSVVPGNMGLHDQALAIRWVHENAAAFGGDPKRVTLFGESAGGMSVNLHLLYPPNRGLFSRAISQSGTAHCPWGIQHKVSAKVHLENLTALSGCESGTSEAVVECLRGKPWEELLEAQNKTQKWFPGLSLPFAPVIEQEGGGFLSEDPDYLMRTGQYMKVPYLMGINEEEGYYVYSEVILKNGKMLAAMATDFNSVGPDLYYYSPHHLKKAAAQDVEEISAKIREFYFKDAPIVDGSITDAKIDEWVAQALVDLSSDRSFNVGVERTARVLTAAGHEQVYAYLFSYKGEHTLVKSLMQDGSGRVVVSHADELQYLFKSARFGGPGGLTKGGKAEQVSKKLVKVWASFAKEGVPGNGSWSWNGVNLGEWKSMKKDSEMHWFELNWEPKVLRDYHKERHEFWHELLAEYWPSSDKKVERYLREQKQKEGHGRHHERERPEPEKIEIVEKGGEKSKGKTNAKKKTEL